jgi:urease accessory protein
MYAAISPSEKTPANAEIIPLHRWADGAAEVSFFRSAGETRLKHLYQSDPCRVLFPRQTEGAAKEAVIVTTSGGIVGGDRLRFDIEAEAGSVASVTTQAAEKVYRSAGADSEIDVSVRVRDGALLEWMPQETILFDGARLRRHTRIDVAGTGRILAGEIVVFGRRARDEAFTYGLLHDDWRLSCDGRLVWADALHLSADIADGIANRHAFDGAAAVATAIYCAPDAAGSLETARRLAGSGGASCVDDVLVVRLVHADAAALRAEFTYFWKRFRHEAAGLPAVLPRVWEV